MKCPILDKECIKDECQWWSQVYEDSCAINSIETLLSEVKEDVSP